MYQPDQLSLDLSPGDLKTMRPEVKLCVCAYHAALYKPPFVSTWVHTSNHSQPYLEGAITPIIQDYRY
jgi:hypothetical protein